MSIEAGCRTFLAGRDPVRLEAPNDGLQSLAEALWVAIPRGERARFTMRLSVEVVRREILIDPEADLRWEVTADETRLEAPGLSLGIRPTMGQATAVVADSLVRRRPDLVTRLVLEAPVTAMKMATRQQVLHAGAVVGPAGAVVLRGASGSGKSTLVAACTRRGLGFLGDESVLVDREDPDLLEATLRDLVLTPESAKLLSLEDASIACLSGTEAKKRVLPREAARPADRVARRAATVLLGPRDPGPARLVPLLGPGFLEAFALGEIPQERMYGGSPERIAGHWNGRRTYLLFGAVDLPGAVALLGDLAHGLERP